MSRIAHTAKGNLTTVGDNSSAIFSLINGTGAGGITINNSGDISTRGIGSGGISSTSLALGGSVITNTGNINSLNGYGIFGSSARGISSITNSGNIRAATTGLFNASSNLTVTEDIRSIVRNDGDIFAGTGIFSSATGGRNVVINSGAITAARNNGYGIFASNSSGDVSVFNNNAIAGSGDGFSGIFAVATNGNVSVTNSADIVVTGLNSQGIFAAASTGQIRIDSTGNILGGAERNRVKPVS
ncbi:hypothetical protein [Hoeflea sp.]|uniref:hypothetical protein n=1 Tax=Hoeflea sp. TaxID=1940281 RepID=UPI003B01830F